MLVLLGVGHDVPQTADRLAEKVRALRVFADAEGRMNEALGEREVLCVSQFTLSGRHLRGNRPSYVGPPPPEQAQPSTNGCASCSAPPEDVRGAQMAVELVNDGPVTMLLEVT